jgi:hypothetical protein
MAHLNHSRALAALTLMAALLLATATAPASARQLYGGDSSSSTYDKCKSAYEAAGGDAGFISRVPTCANATTQDAFFRVFIECCAEAKAALSGGDFAQCLCDQASYEWTRGRAVGAGIQGVTADNWDAFLGACGIARAGKGC